MAHGGATHVDNIERFYLTSCTDLSYKPGNSTTDLETDFSPQTHQKDHLPGKNDPKDQKESPDLFDHSSKSKPSLKSNKSIPRKGHQHLKQGSIVPPDNNEFTETFARVFGSELQPVDHSWMYATTREPYYDEAGNNKDERTLGQLFNSPTVNVIICGVILIGILNIWHHI